MGTRVPSKTSRQGSERVSHLQAGFHMGDGLGLVVQPLLSLLSAMMLRSRDVIERQKCSTVVPKRGGNGTSNDAFRCLK